MSIVYTLICKGKDKVLCEYTEYQGNFEQVSRNLLKKIQVDTRVTFCYAEEFFFHYVNENNITYMCLCDKKLSPETSFAYLEELKTMFNETFTQKEIDFAISYSLNDKFKDLIKGKMNYFNSYLNESDGVAKLRKGVFEYKDIILKANEVLEERGERINLIVNKADNLRKTSKNYYTSVIL